MHRSCYQESLRLVHRTYYHHHSNCYLDVPMFITSYFLSPVHKNSDVILLHRTHYHNIVTTVCQLEFFFPAVPTQILPEKQLRLPSRIFFAPSDFLIVVLFFSFLRLRVITFQLVVIGHALMHTES